jgi:UDP-2,3-diacylglucosamine pyrophosphatase LpxH
MEKPFVDTLILSDLHLGSETSRAKDASRLLKYLSFRRLILLGDIFADLNFARLKKEHWQFLGQVRKLSNPTRGVEVVWVEGNHDRGLAQLMSHLVGVKVYQEYAWTYDGRRHLAIHGHQFDSFSVNSIVLCGVGAWLYLQIQKLDFKHKRFARFLDRLNTVWLRLSPKVAEGALAHAKMHGAERIFCGHTHEQMEAQRNGIRYYNCGAWTNAHPTYITIDDSGVQIHIWLELLEPETIDHSDELTATDADIADTAC